MVFIHFVYPCVGVVHVMVHTLHGVHNCDGGVKHVMVFILLIMLITSMLFIKLIMFINVMVFIQLIQFMQ